jgi:Plavaka transposase
VYRDAYKRLITKPTRQLFVPIIQWIDRTTVTGNGRFSLKPYMFTPAIFNETFRRKIQAWGYHGFLPKPKLSAAQNRGMKLGDNVRNYHAQLYAVLTSFTQAGPSLTNVELPIGPQGSMMQVDIVTCILFVIQDMQEGDTLCGRYGVHTPGIQRHSRSCDVDHINLDNPDFTCTFLNAVDVANIARNPSIAVRKRWSQHELNNVFDHVPMADPVRGIYGATPVETMHAFRKGMIEKVTLVVLQNVPASKLAALDALAIRFHKSHRQTVRKQYPATDFSQGITNLTKISAAERLGLVFLFVILSQYDEGWAILHSVFNTKPAESMDSDSDKEEEEPINLADVIEVFEAMLCFDQWLNQPTFWTALNHAESKARVHDSISTLMHLCVTHIPLSKHKTTWKFPKFHELLHILDNMERFGAPINYCAQRPESLLIPAAKKPGRRAQKRHDGSRFELQSAQRLSYSMMINAVHARIWKTTSPVSESMLSTTSKNCTTGRATFATLTHDFTSGFQCYWHSETHAALLRLDNALMQNVYHHFGSNVRLATEIVCNDTTYRCHPSFQSGGPIYDWMRMTVKHKDKNVDGTSKFSTHPCRLVAVVITSNPQPYRLVVQRASHVTGIASVLFTEWEMSYEYEVFEPSCVEGASFVISITENSSKVLETRPRHLWASQFTEPVDHPVKPPVKKPTRPVQRG